MHGSFYAWCLTTLVALNLLYAAIQFSLVHDDGGAFFHGVITWGEDDERNVISNTSAKTNTSGELTRELCTIWSVKYVVYLLSNPSRLPNVQDCSPRTGWELLKCNEPVLIYAIAVVFALLIAVSPSWMFRKLPKFLGWISYALSLLTQIILLFAYFWFFHMQLAYNVNVSYVDWMAQMISTLGWTFLLGVQTALDVYKGFKKNKKKC
jgi:hypothetical protein